MNEPADLAHLLRWTNELLSRNNELLASLVTQALRPVLEDELARPKNQLLYKLTGGDLPVAAISKKIGMAAGTISETWQRWEREGLLIKDAKRYRKVLG